MNALPMHHIFEQTALGCNVFRPAGRIGELF